MGGEYTVGSAYRALNQFIIEEDDERAFSILWKLKIPSKVSHFAWRLVRDRLPTRMNLRSRHIVMVKSAARFAKTTTRMQVICFLDAPKLCHCGGRPCHG